MGRMGSMLWGAILGCALLGVAAPGLAQDDGFFGTDEEAVADELTADEDEGLISIDEDEDEGLISIDEDEEGYDELVIEEPDLSGDEVPAAAAQLVRDFYSSAERNWNRHVSLLDEGLERFSEGIKDEPPPEQPSALDVLLGFAVRLATTHFFAQLKVLDTDAVGEQTHLNISGQLKAAHPRALELQALSGAGGGQIRTAGDWIQQARKVLTDEAMTFANEKDFIDSMEGRFLEADEDERLTLFWDLTTAYEALSESAMLTSPDERDGEQRAEIHALRGEILKDYWERWFQLANGEAELDPEQSCIERGGCVELWFHTDEFVLVGGGPGDLALVDSRAYVGERKTVERQIQNMNREFGFGLSDFGVPRRLCFDYASDFERYRRIEVGLARWRLESGATEPAPELAPIPGIYRKHCAWIDADGDTVVEPEDDASRQILESRLFRDAWGRSVKGFSEEDL